MARLIIIGLDGAEPSLAFPWARAGHLPNLQWMIERGAWGDLRSTLHPLTPQAWTSLITAVNPGRHGIFDFGKRATGGYEVELTTSADRVAPAFWQFAPEGARLGVANVPLSWPPAPLPGFMVTGMHTPTIEQGVWPPEILSDLGGDYPIDVMAHWYDTPEEFLARVFAMHGAHHGAFLRLFDHHAPDLSLFVYVLADRLQHALWREMTAAHREDPTAHDDLGGAIFAGYRALDDALGAWRERLEPDDHLLVVSDHGFGELRRDVYLNRVLLDAGLLRFDPAKVRAFAPPAPSADADPRHSWMHRRLPAVEELPADDNLLTRGLCDPRRLTFATVDWRKTVAYSRGLFGNVWLNRAGREPDGIVIGHQIAEVTAWVKEALLAVTDPDDGLPVVDAVVRKEEIYHGDCLPQAPDLLVIMRDYAYITRGATEFWGRRPVGPPAVNHSGNHRLHGVLLAAGPKIQPGEIAGANIMDVVPSAFHLLNWPVPNDLDGHVLTAMCAANHRAVTFGPPAPALVRDPRVYADAERGKVIERLKALGYLG